ncbi:methyltransferase domain protein, partial [Chlamydia ibidis]
MPKKYPIKNKKFPPYDQK